LLKYIIVRIIRIVPLVLVNPAGTSLWRS